MTAPFRFTRSVEVRFRDCDPMGHVNNAVYLTYLEVARFGYWREVVGEPGVFPGLILARAEADFRAPAGPGDVLEVRLRVDAIGRTSFTFVAEIVRPADGVKVLDARTVMVVYDYEAARPVPVPGVARAAMAAFEQREF
ncbi:MAG: thioesterase family protein [Acidobacteriota bacterium]